MGYFSKNFPENWKKLEASEGRLVMTDFSLEANLSSTFALEVRHLVCLVQKKTVKQIAQDLFDLDKAFPVTHPLICCVIQQVWFSGE